MESKVSQCLERAYEIFKARGGAVGKYEDSHGNVCGLGALLRVGTEFTFSCRERAQKLLHAQAVENYVRTIADVNDNLGRDAVNHCYELAIKQAHEEENDA